MFRAYDAGRERLVAVKLFKLDLPPERVHQLVAAFEQLIASDLTHPVMAVPLGTGIANVSAYLAQDYVAAESLDLAVREYGPAPGADALRVAAQLAGALDFAAVVHVAHGALHPRDILLSSDETRLTGVGVARALESVGVAAPIRRPYTAPERIAGGPWDRRADVFSLAALIHELLWARRITGTGDHIADSLTELQGADLPQLRNVFARALADDPAARFETALDFVEALKGAFPGVTISDAKEKPERPAVRGRRQSKAAEPLLPLDTPRESEGETASDAARSLAGFDPDAINLRAPEAPRFEHVEEIPAAAVGAGDVAPMREEPVQEAPTISLIEESRSAVWPLVASLLIGLALGFAGGYGVGTRERPSPIAPAASNPLRPSASGRDATEVAVGEQSQVISRQSPVETRPSVSSPQSAVTSRRSAVTSPQPAVGGPPSKRTQSTSGSAQSPKRPRATEGQTKIAQEFSGKLDVDSRPAGARVFLDGRLVGTTPLAIPSVRAGEHAIRLERDGYRRWSSSVRVVAAEQNRVTASLER